MRLVQTSSHLNVEADDGRLAGRYTFDDEFKPSLHPLMTPGGVLMSACMPHDHKHHRGLMYALRTPDINFWEERPAAPCEVVGRQAHRHLEGIESKGLEVGFAQRIDWLATDRKQPLFIETRRIACRMGADESAFIWHWSTELEVLSDTTLIMSQWSSPRTDGALVNYHGLGLRLPREFGGAQADPRIQLDGVPTAINEAMGRVPNFLEFVAAADGHWPVRYGGVRISQFQDNPLFIMKDPFAYISLGSSNLRPRPLTKGQIIHERYCVEVFDASAPSTGDG